MSTSPLRASRDPLFGWSLSLLTVLVVAGCSEGTGPNTTPPLDCTDASTRTLAVGEHQIIDINQAGACVRLPAAGASGAQHLYIPLATAGTQKPAGVSATYEVTGSAPATAAPPAMPSPMLSAFQSRPQVPEAFHAMLRERERTLTQSGSAALFSLGRAAGTPAPKPVVGDKDSLDVCATSACKTFVRVGATARSVGDQVAIFVDDAAPAGGYTDADLDDVRALFDQHLYPIDTTAFGRESDIDANQVVIVLLTPRVNALSPNCNSTGEIILGYFFGADLLPRSSTNPGSNEAEIFYGLVPGTVQNCTIPTAEATTRLPATFIHEFQHMISFNQHVLVRRGSGEDTWLNEGLSHFAEELGGRLVPDAECPNSFSCADEFLGGGDLRNAFDYLEAPEDFFLIEPGISTGKLQERGANWLFVRWLLDQFASIPVLGTDLTRQLLATDQVGSTNVAARTGVDFSTLVGQWQLTNYLDHLPGFVEPTGRLQYKSWNFREVADSTGVSFPLVPDNTDGSSYVHSGVLRAGSGRHVLVTQAAGAGPVDLQVTTPAGSALPASIKPRVALVRIR